MVCIRTCVATSVARGNDFVPFLKTNLIGTASSVVAYSLSGFAIKVGRVRLTLWLGESHAVFHAHCDDG